MRRSDPEHVHQAGRVSGHVGKLVGRCDRNLQKTQLQKFQRGKPRTAGKLARLADVAVVETDHTKAARGKLFAEVVVPQDHLGAEAHDQEHRLRFRVAENLVADVDTVGAGDLRSLMGNRTHETCSLGSSDPTLWHGFSRRRRVSRGEVDRVVATVWYGAKEGSNPLGIQEGRDG